MRCLLVVPHPAPQSPSHPSPRSPPYVSPQPRQEHRDLQCSLGGAARIPGSCSSSGCVFSPPGTSSGPGGGRRHRAHPHLLASADNPRDPGALCLGHLVLDTHPCTLLLYPAPLHWLQYDPSCCGYLPAGPLPAFRILEDPRSAPSSGSPAPSKPLANGLNPLSFGKGVSLTF